MLLGLGGSFALLLATREPVVDAVTIVTIPSGAEVSVDGTAFGPSPVRLEGMRAGTHTVRVAKDGFLPLERGVELRADTEEPLAFELTAVAPPGSTAETPDEQVAEFRALAEAAFARGDLIIPYEGSAFYFGDAILSIERKNAYALELRRRVRDALIREATAAAGRGDPFRAKALLGQISEYFPGDEEVTSASESVEGQLRRQRARVRELLAEGEAALRAGRLVRPRKASALYFASQALASDPASPAARDLMRRVRDVALARARLEAASGRAAAASALLRELTRHFPDDRVLGAEIRAAAATPKSGTRGAPQGHPEGPAARPTRADKGPAEAPAATP
jgi:hypothetical protein